MSAPGVFRQVAREAMDGDWPVNLTLVNGGTLHGIPYVPDDHDDSDAFAVSGYSIDRAERSVLKRYFVADDTMPRWVRWDAVIAIQHGEHSDDRAVRA